MVKWYAYRDPMIFKQLFGIETFIDVHFQQVLDQILQTNPIDSVLLQYSANQTGKLIVSIRAMSTYYTFLL